MELGLNCPPRVPIAMAASVEHWSRGGRWPTAARRPALRPSHGSLEIGPSTSTTRRRGTWLVGPSLAVPVAATAACHSENAVPNSCCHVDQIDSQARPSADGCEDCLRTGGRGVHLRMCRVCGHVGCCDSPPSRHAKAHHASAGHPLVSSFEPAEDWWWCFEDEFAFAVPDQLSYSHS